MNQDNGKNIVAALNRIRSQASEENIRVSQHAQQEMVEDEFTLDDVIEGIEPGDIIENYPEHKRGVCCLINGSSQGVHPIHIVCTTTQPKLIIITVYEPKAPKWITPTQRRSKDEM
ncbi:MAG: DUF4258 domain-containing protein [bacterium]|nr:MAG: DUF4258 domain-containing protein [bacterium]